MEISKGRKTAAFIGLVIAAFTTYFVISGSGVFVYGAGASFVGGTALVGLALTLESATRCVMLPISSQLGNKFGRKRTFNIGMIGYTLCCILIAFGLSMEMFVAARMLMGIFWGMFMVTGMAMITDMYSTDESPKRVGWYQSCILISTLLGSPLAGVCADLVGWQFEFIACIPLLVISFLLVSFCLPKQKDYQDEPIDVAGCVLMIVCLIPFSLVMSWGGTAYAWTDPLILCLIAVAVVAFIAFLFAERKAQAPLFPAYLLKNKNFTMMFLMVFCFSLFNCAGNYAPSYMQGVMGTSATISGGIGLIGSIVAAVGASVIGSYVGKHGRFKGLLAIYAFLTLLAGICYFMVSPTCPWWLFYIVGTLAGAANCVQQVVPNTYPMVALPEKYITTTMGLMTFAGSFANTVGTGFFGAIMNVSFDMVFQITPIFGILMVVFWLFFKDTKKSNN